MSNSSVTDFDSRLPADCKPAGERMFLLSGQPFRFWSGRRLFGAVKRAVTWAYACLCTPDVSVLTDSEKTTFQTASDVRPALRPGRHAGAGVCPLGVPGAPALETRS